MKLLRKIDSYFLYDAETGESAPLGDKIIFYGVMSLLIIVGAVFTIANILNI